MEYLIRVNNFNNYDDNFSENSVVDQKCAIVDVFNKKSYNIKNVIDFYTNLHKIKTKHLAELPLQICPLLCDFDMKIKSTVVKSLYSEKDVKCIIREYISVLNTELENPPEKYIVCYLSKPPKLVEGYVKHGFHLHFISICTSLKNLNKIYDKVKLVSKYNDKLDNIVGKPWLLYGSSKDDQSLPYTLDTTFEIYKDEIKKINLDKILIGESMSDLIVFNDENIKSSYPLIFSVRMSGIFSFQQYVDFKKIKQHFDLQEYKVKMNLNDEINKVSISKENLFLESKNFNLKTKISNEKILQITLGLSDERSDNYNDWIKILFILINIANERDSKDFFKQIFHLFSQKSKKYDEYECDDLWENNYEKSTNEIGLGTLVWMYKIDNNLPDYKNLFYDFNFMTIPIDDYDIAEQVKVVIEDDFITNNVFGCFQYKNNCWELLRGWDHYFKIYINKWYTNYKKEMRNKLNEYKDDEKTYKNYLKLLERLNKKVRSYSGLNNICKSLFELYFDKNLEKCFEVKTHILGFNNIVFDIENWKLISPCPSQYLNIKVNHDLIKWENVDKCDKDYILDFFNKLFPDEELRKYVVKSLARIFTGSNCCKQFFFLTGSGHNGKSVFVKLFQIIFGKMAVKLPKSVVMGENNKKSTQPEIVRLNNSRMAFVDELTPYDLLDPGQIKLLSGNDSLFCRDLYQKSSDIVEVVPTFFPFIITNNIPIIKKPDEATWNRIRLIPFESKFELNVDAYKSKNPSAKFVFKRDPNIVKNLNEKAKYFISYLMSFLSSFDNSEEFNSEEEIPIKVQEGLILFKEKQNTFKKFMDNNYIEEENTEYIPVCKLLKEYNYYTQSDYDMDEFSSILNEYANDNPNIDNTSKHNYIKGIRKVI